MYPKISEPLAQFFNCIRVISSFLLQHKSCQTIIKALVIIAGFLLEADAGVFNFQLQKFPYCPLQLGWDNLFQI